MNQPTWLETAVFYEIYPQSFYDSNGDGIGDLAGVCEKLPYVKSLGANAIWLNPFYESPFGDAGYDVTDFYRVAPRYGTNDDFAALCKRAHSLGIRVICDLVPAHTSIEHPWFRKSAAAERNAYSDRYIWCDDDSDPEPKLNKRDYPRKDRYYCSFFAIQPALNFGFAHPTAPWQMPPDAPACRENRKLLLDIMNYWIGLGCDGFRVDMAGTLVKNDPGFVENEKLWRELRDALRAAHPDAVLISEWSNPRHALKAGFSMDMFLSGGSLFRHEDTSPNKSYFRKEGEGVLARFADDYTEILQKTREDGYFSFVSGNHDQPRISVGRDVSDLMAVFAFLLTMPGVPILYYGDEIGMKYIAGLEKEGSKNRGGSRTPMQWTVSGKHHGFSDADVPYLPTDSDDNAPTVEAQEKDPASLLHFVREMIQLRLSHRALCADGLFRFVDPALNYPLWYERKIGDEIVCIAINPTAKPLTIRENRAIPAILKSVRASCRDGEITLAEDGILIYRV